MQSLTLFSFAVRELRPKYFYLNGNVCCFTTESISIIIGLNSYCFFSRIHDLFGTETHFDTAQLSTVTTLLCRGSNFIF